ncbi:MAG TPA: response regulator [Methanocorpusculum sp.]|nr:response regulator [Methanocorpusculum sp.]
MTQTSDKLGAIPLSSDILVKANLGLWAFELDEGKPPRMYVNTTMLGLIGLTEQKPPEETYHAWYDNIDNASYDLVTEAVNKMVAGEHAEVQYPWHHPNGSTFIVRCGGVRNFAYTQGIRIEGVHQNVTEVLHYRSAELQRVTDKLKQTQAFTNFFVDSFVSAYYIGLTDLSCTIYHRTAELDKNYPVLDNYLASVTDYINKDVHADDRKRMLEAVSPDYIRARLAKEPSFSVTMRDISGSVEKIYRFQAIRGADADHAAIGFTDITHEAEEEAQARKVELLAGQSKDIINSMAKEFRSLYRVSFADDTLTVLGRSAAMEKKYGRYTKYSEALRNYIETDVLENDRAMMHKETTPAVIQERLAVSDSYFVDFREYSTGIVRWHRMQVRNLPGAEDLLLGFAERDREIVTGHITKRFFDDYFAIYMVSIPRNRVKVIKGTDFFFRSESAEIYQFDEIMPPFIATVKEKDREHFRTLLSPEGVRNYFSDADRREYVYESPNVAKHAATGWTKVTYYVTERVNGEADNYVMCFSLLDSEQIKKLKLSELVATQKEQLEEQQKALEEALQLAQSANRAKTTFLNNMSHDIRTPMNAIIGYTGLAASHIDNKDQVQSYLTKIGQSSDHLLSLINDVLDMSRIESGKMNISENEENLPDIIHTLRDIVQADINAKQLEFFIDSVDVHDERIVCDKLRLNQILLNVLSNAVKYTPAGGIITFRVTEKTRAPTASGYAGFEFRIKDNGIGMDAEFLKTIYDPFTRVKSSTVSGIQGTGLGMAITKSIVDMMGGEIDIRSEPEKGTEVILNFSFKIAGGRKCPDKIPDIEGMRGLVVDDDSNTCISVSKMLRDAGMRSEWCVSGKEAVIRTTESLTMGDLFKVYIIDWLMPDMNGIETTRRIRKIVGSEAPIIILTAYDWSDIEEEAREAGVTGFVSKPLFPSDLHRVLKNCCGHVEEGAEESVSGFDFTGKKILLVEDNLMNQEIAQEILEEHGLCVATADDGTQAVEIMKAAKPGDFDLILMDIQMPLMNGYDATRAIRNLDSPAAQIPIIAMTANAFEEDKQLALEAGMNDHVPKPIDIEKLKAAMAKFL